MRFLLSSHETHRAVVLGYMTQYAPKRSARKCCPAHRIGIFWASHPNLSRSVGAWAVADLPDQRSERTMGNSLRHKTVVVVGGGSGIARAVASLTQSEGARVIVAGWDRAKLAN